jgi:Na+/melibiose symporter-like transporter
MIAAVILDQTGFIANVVQNVNVQDGLKAMMSVIPVSIGVVALILLAFFYKLNEQTMRKVKADLDSRRIESTEKSGAA